MHDVSFYSPKRRSGHTSSEPFQRTDISMYPLGPTNYTGSNTTPSKYRVVDRVLTSATIAKSSSASIKEECKLDVSTAPPGRPPIRGITREDWDKLPSGSRRTEAGSVVGKLITQAMVLGKYNYYAKDQVNEVPRSIADGVRRLPMKRKLLLS